MNTATREESRPIIVTVVAIYVAVHLAIAVLTHITVAQWSDLHFQIKLAVMLLLAIIPLCLWRGQRWARWAVLCVLLVGLGSSVVELLQRRDEYSGLEIAIQTLRSVPTLVVVLSLFHPCSATWFCGGANAANHAPQRL